MVVFGVSSVVAVESSRVTVVYPVGRSGVPREFMTSHACQWVPHACVLSRGTTGCLEVSGERIGTALWWCFVVVGMRVSVVVSVAATDTTTADYPGDKVPLGCHRPPPADPCVPWLPRVRGA